MDFGRAPRGARGLKWLRRDNLREYRGRAPRGARGLKCLHDLRLVDGVLVVPLAGHVD